MNKISLLFIILFSAVILAQNQKNSEEVSTATFGVTIGGNFPVTGTFPSYMNERADQFVSRIFNGTKSTILSKITDPQMYRDIEKEYEKYSFRNITLKRLSGEEMKLDLIKFRKTGDFSQNPYLKHDDVLIFPPTDLQTNFFTVSGAVMEPGKFHFFEGDKLSDAIELAGGVNKAYENVDIKIYRTNFQGDRTDIINVAAGEDPELNRADRIVLDGGENQKKDYNVIVVGEVKNPGTVPVSKSNTTLKEVIDRAGGLKEDASLKNSRLYTGNSAKYILEKLYGVKIGSKEYYDFMDEKLSTEAMNLDKIMMFRLSGLTETDTGYFSIENQLRILAEGSAVDFSTINESSSASAQYIVRDGDIIIIPEKRNTVYIFGNVAHTGYIPFEDGKNVDFYIEKAGGLSQYAQADEIYVIKGGTRKWIPLEENPMIEEGDFIFVPKDQPHSFNYYVDVVARYLGILGSAATVILLLVQFGK